MTFIRCDLSAKIPDLCQVISPNRTMFTGAFSGVHLYQHVHKTRVVSTINNSLRPIAIL